jgi:hypothetical protein
MLLVSCGSPARTTPTAGPTLLPRAPTASPTASTPLVILLLPADTPQEQLNQYEKLIYDLSQANGMRFQVRNTLTPEDIAFEGPALKVVVVLPPDPNLAALTAAAPGVQFLAVGIPDLAPAANLSSVGAAGAPVDQQAFLAGYMAAMLAPEWRVGILTLKDSPEGDVAWHAFTNGYHFYCGYCRNPNFTQPSLDYPIVIRIAADVPAAQYPAYADALANQYFVKVAYVFPGLATSDLLSYMAQSKMLVIGETLPDEESRPHWVASIRPDLISAIQKIFPELLAGQGGQIVPTPLFLSDVNPDLLSDAKLRLVQEVLDGLQNGSIGALVP